MLKCQFCGFESDPKDFELDTVHNDGFWCPNCDGHTFYDNEKNKEQNYTLIFEDKKGIDIHCKSPVKFNKRLSPLRYPGGKSKIIDYLYTKIQKSNTDYFVEPYAGGASVGLAFLEAKVINHLVINDIDFGIYALFTTIKKHPQFLINKISHYMPTHDDYFECQQEVLSNYKDSDIFSAAWSMLIVNRLSYSGICKANPLGGKHGSQSTLLARWNPDELCKRISKISNMAEKITVTNIDACDLIAEMYWKNNTTIFCDPPYFNKGKQLYNHYYNSKDHIRLCVLLDSLYSGMPGANIILTYDKESFIEDNVLYPNIEYVSRNYSI